jgi:hypothetical protein
VQERGCFVLLILAVDRAFGSIVDKVNFEEGFPIDITTYMDSAISFRTMLLSEH